MRKNEPEREREMLISWMTLYTDLHHIENLWVIISLSIYVKERSTIKFKGAESMISREVEITLRMGRYPEMG